MEGREMRGRIRDDETPKRIPTVILTTPDAEPDIATTHKLHADC